jgi:hypothetical protein
MVDLIADALAFFLPKLRSAISVEQYIVGRSILLLARDCSGGTAASHTCGVWGAVIF